MSSYDERFQEQLGQARSVADARQKFLDMIYARMEAEENARMAEEQNAEQAGKLNWFDDAAKGAQMGSAMGPWGALAGGVIGTIKGQKESYDARGGGGLKGYLQTAFDTPFGVNLAGGKSHQSLGGGTMDSMIGAAGTAYGVKQRNDAMKSPAADIQARERLKQRELAVTGGPGYMAPQARMGYDRPVSSQRTGFDVDTSEADLYRSDFLDRLYR